ncbi:putative NBD/HSP70 family sugar kinase [Edaphobacter aggregans]|uniref:Putative NBD/HSP70 family sugar kinase n=1 Tax=Edaphobacter aggregans TaxID=570835 RepID=A0A3R9Q9D9_9BACT|nr:putative NBD/HSP70 family sugar kinase [Edaphobacter aggregans]
MRLDKPGIRHVDLTELQLASSETARIINRDIVLELIRTSQPISRADLARRSGLGRSTVSQIVEQLIDENWVREGAMGSLPRGRRPTMVGLNGDLVAIAVDVHPGQASVAIVDLNGRLLSRRPVPITSDPAASVRLIIECIQRIRPTALQKSTEGIGISLPGRVNPTTQRLIFAPNLKWPEFDIKKMVETKLGLPVMLENDATACLMAERIFARMDGVKDAVLVAVGEGVGTCVLANGQVFSGHNGMAGEFGHILVDPNGPRCACGQHGCWELYSSGRAALRYYRELKPKGNVVTFQELLNRAEDGDSAAAQALTKQATWIGRGLRMIIASVSPSMILIAGDLTAAWHRFGPVIEKEAADLTLAGSAPLIRPTHEGEIARLRGAAALVFQRGARRTTSAGVAASSAKSA